MRVVNDFETIPVRERPNRRYDEDSLSVSSHSTHYRQTHGLNQQPLPTEMFAIDSDAEACNDHHSVSSVELTADDDDDFLSAVRQHEMEVSSASSVEARSIHMKSHLDEYTDSSHRHGSPPPRPRYHSTTKHDTTMLLVPPPRNQVNRECRCHPKAGDCLHLVEGKHHCSHKNAARTVIANFKRKYNTRTNWKMRRA